MARTFHFPVIGIILATFVILAVIYSVATPIFEASDEIWHFPVVQHLKATGQLPVQQPGVKTLWEQEGSQPPLYYAVMALAISPIDISDFPDRLYVNPHAAPGDPSLDANRNLIIHLPAEDFPWRNTTLAVHLIRFISIIMGAVTVAIGYVLARRIFPDPRTRSISIGTAAVIAFNPMFIFISASVNNDNLTILLTSLALYLGVLCWYEPLGPVSRLGWGRRLLLGVVLGGAALSKISGLTLLPIVGLILMVRHLRQRDWRGWIASGVVVALPVLVMAGWWYARNVQLYGEMFGLNTMVAIAGPRSMSLFDLLPEFDGFRYSYWALFGAVNIVTFPLAYVIFDVFTLISFIGCIIWFARHRRSEPFALLLILAIYTLIVFVGVVRWTMMTPASQGRLMFPAISAISLLMWLGWETLLDLKLRRVEWVKWSMPAFMLVTSTIVPFRDLAPAYAGPQMIGDQQLPADLKRLDVDYGDQLRLIGYHVTETVARTDSAEFTLYWQCLKPIQADYSVFVIMYGRGLGEVGKRDAYPDGGLYATRQCLSGMIFADPYRIPIKQDAARPTILRAQIGLKDWARKVELQPAANGVPVAAVVLPTGRLGAPADETLKPQIESHYRLGDAIELVGYDAPQFERAQGLLKYRLYWRTLGTPAQDYTLFAHVLDADGKLIGQGDSQPFGGDYPTSVWRAGETLIEERALTLAPGTLPDNATLAIGLYRLADGARLPVIDVTGQRARDDQVIIRVQP